MKLFAIALIAFASAACSLHGQSLAVGLAWSASANSTASDQGTVQVYRAAGTCAANPTSGGKYTEITSSAPAAGPYEDATVTVGQTYAYYVTATLPDYSTPSLPSNCAQITVVESGAPAAPTGLTLTIIGATTPAATAIKPAAVGRPAPPRFGPQR